MAGMMIDGIRRRFVKSIDSDPWATDQELEPEPEEEITELPTDTAVILAATRVAPSSATNEVESGEYYKGLVKTAIANGGKYGDHQIPIPWLRMVLAGLEWKRIDLEMMWYDAEADAPTGELLPEVPSYEDLFPSDRDVPTGPR